MDSGCDGFMEIFEHGAWNGESRAQPICKLKIDRKNESAGRDACTVSRHGPHISWPIDHNLEVLSLTPCFSGVKTASKAVGTVSYVLSVVAQISNLLYRSASSLRGV